MRRILIYTRLYTINKKRPEFLNSGLTLKPKTQIRLFNLSGFLIRNFFFTLNCNNTRCMVVSQLYLTSGRFFKGYLPFQKNQLVGVFKQHLRCKKRCTI